MKERVFAKGDLKGAIRREDLENDAISKLADSQVKKSYARIKERLNKIGITFSDPKITIRETAAKLDHHYVSEIGNMWEIIYTQSACGFYNFDKKEIVVDMHRIRGMLEAKHKSEFGSIAGITKEQEEKMVLHWIDELFETPVVAQHVVHSSRIFQETWGEIQTTTKFRLSKSMRGEERDVMNTILAGTNEAAQLIIEALISGREEYGGYLDKKLQDYTLKHFNNGMSLIDNLFVSQLKFAKEHPSGYCGAPEDGYYYTSERFGRDDIGNTFARILIERHGLEEAGRIVMDPKRFAQELGTVTRKEFKG